MASFTQFLATCDAVFDKDTDAYIRRFTVLLSKK
jgi:hypothetical protein